jgi:transposase InsO family protein
MIRDRFQNTREIEGAGRIQPFLKSQGHLTSISTVGRLMKEMGLKPRKKRKFRHTTDSNHPHTPSPFRAKGLIPTRIHHVWVSDITFVWTQEGWLYVAFIMDLASRKIVGYAMGESLKTDLILAALTMAVLNEKPGRGIIFHSDKGSQYASKVFREALKSLGFDQSMGETGRCYDNAFAEALNHAYKIEIVYPTDFKARAEAREYTFWWVEVYYNRKRYHSSIGSCVPEDKHVELRKDLNEIAA